ncbi:tRNA (N(6)-L-threonylcarbamoyladenosine(37)-C(2))-methylthiotransferase MtaB [Phorcysia thermohydrogeniphila]|uniref:Threonylcarbamoyladenosine tRNA methylthiotransferase MtaB n=1 Tax=Phorcysia thermohydrogeniphila TaxID=936138 RepID=A0A4R1GEX0_9BACT|nr:tRNA (N(6)-L-threonylcarbamoyladenosine(37)-C(2))-methylthiotransferase MtaB [Phorcysia thermohydrogeniphila]TCK06558.1 threonylcarbamoyladenosine tRNA methylthiotransferase MtaB [Phorcysia thermohydrogeniphila]
MKRVAFYTLGCKMNFHETAYMEELFKKAGYEVVDFDEEADIYIVNTCTVTSTADAKSRKALRKAKQKNPKALIVATGCYSEVYPEEVEKVKEVDFITGNTEKFHILELVEKRLKGELPRIHVKGVWKDRNFYPLTIRHYEGRTRAFLKVQQGCELFCSYCIIPKARGKMVSEEPQRVIEQVKELVDAGYKEIVLTGTHLGAYGVDLEGNWNLAKLIEELVKIPGLYRLRISSVEPIEFTDDLIEVVTGSEKVAPHLHIPLQSGSNRILTLMRRRYRAEDFRKVVEKILSRNPEICIGTDVMVGFPGEREEDFEETRKFVEEIPFGYLHVFPYSKRKGTVAATMKDDVPPEVKKERASILREIGKRKSVAYRERFVGRELEALVLSQLPDGNSTALTGNYIRVILNEELKPGEVVKVKLTKVGEKREENYGEVVDRALLRNESS